MSKFQHVKVLSFWICAFKLVIGLSIPEKGSSSFRFIFSFFWKFPYRFIFKRVRALTESFSVQNTDTVQLQKPEIRQTCVTRNQISTIQTPQRNLDPNPCPNRTPQAARETQTPAQNIARNVYASAIRWASAIRRSAHDGRPMSCMSVSVCCGSEPAPVIPISSLAFAMDLLGARRPSW
jgi:hypothetical protein